MTRMLGARGADGIERRRKETGRGAGRVQAGAARTPVKSEAPVELDGSELHTRLQGSPSRSDMRGGLLLMRRQAYYPALRLAFLCPNPSWVQPLRANNVASAGYGGVGHGELFQSLLCQVSGTVAAAARRAPRPRPSWHIAARKTLGTITRAIHHPARRQRPNLAELWRWLNATRAAEDRQPP
jgi:hypothetical protein